MEQSVSDLGRQMREALRGTVRRYSPFYLAQGVLMIVLGLVALVYPLITSVALVVTLGWLLILHGLLQAIGVIGLRTSSTSGFSFFLQSLPELSASFSCPNLLKASSFSALF
jgi:uncharacterized membrane protein HdeD (DUF308 family)